MGSSISAIYDDYREYERLCKEKGVNAMPIRVDKYLREDNGFDSFYEHRKYLEKIKG